jgi:GMP synthase-like glutamine amidotransferase
MRIHYIMHDPHEGLGCIEQWAFQRGYALSVTRIYEKSYLLPDTSEIDFLILMGGPMGTYEEEKYSWLLIEKEFIRKCIRRGIIVLGICLGSQLIADALGADVYKNTQQEIGWFPVYKSKEAGLHTLFDFLPEELMVFHWHGDTFDLPNGATHILSSKLTRNQAFAMGNQVVGLQFHYEATKYSIQEMMKTSDEELEASDYVQNEREIIEHAYLAEHNNQIMFQILDRMVSLNTKY